MLTPVIDLIEITFKKTEIEKKNLSMYLQSIKVRATGWNCTCFGVTALSLHVYVSYVYVHIYHCCCCFKTTLQYCNSSAGPCEFADVCTSPVVEMMDILTPRAPLRWHTMGVMITRCELLLIKRLAKMCSNKVLVTKTKVLWVKFLHQTNQDKTW